MRYLAAILALVSVYAWGQCTIDGVPKSTCTITTTGPIIPPGPPPCNPPNVIIGGVCTAPPITPPPVSGCPAVVSWNLHPVQLWPVLPLTGTGECGRSVQIIADANSWPRGIIIMTDNESQPTKGQDYVISAAPYDYNAVGGNPGCVTMNASISSGIAIRFGGPIDGSCILNPGGVYYINFRAVDRDFVSSQFVNSVRTD